MSNAIVWFRNDLRLHDNKALTRAIQENESIVCIYIFDPFWWRKTDMKRSKTGVFRTQFLLESVKNLRENLRTKGSDLVVRFGATADVFKELLSDFAFENVYYQQSIAYEEQVISNQIQSVLPNVKFHSVDSATLFNWNVLPFQDINKFPNGFTSFRKKVESKNVAVQPVVHTPNEIAAPPVSISLGEIPELSSFGLMPQAVDQRAVLQFVGGENEALKRLNEYVWQTKQLGFYKKTRNGLLGANYSSKFSAWLALGCISPKFIYQEVKRFESEVVKNESTYWLIFELMWRDFFHFTGRKFGNQIFHEKGIKWSKTGLSKDSELFEKWRLGETGIPFIDANMKELLLTGFMSNRGRQNVASFLVKDLGLDWRMGAAWFEHQLIDYDVFSNYGNWNYIAGVGTNPRENRWFNVVHQGIRYDSKGKYLKYWLPELSSLSEAEIHRPYAINEERINLLELPIKYKEPVFINDRWD